MVGLTNSIGRIIVPNSNIGHNAVINIVAETGSTITILIQTTSVVLKPEKGKSSTQYSGYSEWQYIYKSSISSSMSCQIIATKGLQTCTETITLSPSEDHKEYDVLLFYDLYLIKDGLFNTDYTHTLYGPSTSSLTENSNGYVYLYSANKSSTYATCCIEAVDITYYKYLVFDGQARGYYSASVCPAFGILLSISSGGSNSTFRSVKMIRTSKQSSFNSRGTLYLDISLFKYKGRIGLQEAGSGSSPAVYGGIQCYNLYLSNTVPT